MSYSGNYLADVYDRDYERRCKIQDDMDDARWERWETFQRDYHLVDAQVWLDEVTDLLGEDFRAEYDTTEAYSELERLAEESELEVQ